jgi:hypothetical protein
LLGLAEDRSHVVQVRLARGCQAHAARQSIQQRHASLRFHGLHTRAGSGEGQVLRLRGMRDAGLLRDCMEEPQI